MKKPRVAVGWSGLFDGLVGFFLGGGFDSGGDDGLVGVLGDEGGGFGFQLVHAVAAASVVSNVALVDVTTAIGDGLERVAHDGAEDEFLLGSGGCLLGVDIELGFALFRREVVADAAEVFERLGFLGFDSETGRDIEQALANQDALRLFGLENGLGVLHERGFAAAAAGDVADAFVVDDRIGLINIFGGDDAVEWHGGGRSHGDSKQECGQHDRIMALFGGI